MSTSYTWPSGSNLPNLISDTPALSHTFILSHMHITYDKIHSVFVVFGTKNANNISRDCFTIVASEIGLSTHCGTNTLVKNLHGIGSLWAGNLLGSESGKEG